MSHKGLSAKHYTFMGDLKPFSNESRCFTLNFNNKNISNTIRDILSENEEESKVSYQENENSHSQIDLRAVNR